MDKGQVLCSISSSSSSSLTLIRINSDAVHNNTNNHNYRERNDTNQNRCLFIQYHWTENVIPCDRKNITYSSTLLKTLTIFKLTLLQVDWTELNFFRGWSYLHLYWCGTGPTDLNQKYSISSKQRVSSNAYHYSSFSSTKYTIIIFLTYFKNVLLESHYTTEADDLPDLLLWLKPPVNSSQSSCISMYLHVPEIIEHME